MFLFPVQRRVIWVLHGSMVHCHKFFYHSGMQIEGPSSLAWWPAFNFLPISPAVFKNLTFSRRVYDSNCFFAMGSIFIYSSDPCSIAPFENCPNYSKNQYVSPKNCWSFSKPHKWFPGFPVADNSKRQRCSPSLPNTLWGSVFGPTNTSLRRSLGDPNTDPHKVWLEDFGRLGLGHRNGFLGRGYLFPEGCGHFPRFRIAPRWFVPAVAGHRMTTPLLKVTLPHLTAPPQKGPRLLKKKNRCHMDPFKKDFLGAVSVAKMIFPPKKILKFRLGIRIPIFFTQDSCSCSKKRKTPPKTPRKLRCISSAFRGHIFRCTDVRFQEVSPAKSPQLDVSGSLDQWLQ